MRRVTCTDRSAGAAAWRTVPRCWRSPSAASACPWRTLRKRRPRPAGRGFSSSATACRPNTASSAAAAGSRCSSSASRKEGIHASVVNASISGDTTAGGRSRLPALLKQNRPDVVILELGANDALRGLPLEGTQANLAAMARASRDAGARVLILGMQVPPNYGRQYSDRFAALFARRGAGREARRWCRSCSRAWPTGRTPNRCSSRTGSIPSRAAHPMILANVWPALKPLLKS